MNVIMTCRKIKQNFECIELREMVQSQLVKTFIMHVTITCYFFYCS